MAVVAAMVAAGVITIGALTIPPQPVLSIVQIQVTNLCVAGWTPHPEWDTNGPDGIRRGSGSIVTNFYTGPATLIACSNLSQALAIECSTDLFNWQQFPPIGFQLLLQPSNPVAIVASPEPILFFRSRTLP
jgi:hypothetical protein